MRSFLYRHGLNAMFVFLFASALLIVFYPESIKQLIGLSWPAFQSFAAFKTIFLGILLETLPFLLLGVVVSSAMQLFVSESFIRKIIPRHPLLGVPFACLLGFLFPVCECGLIPIVRRLLAKGMPLYIGIIFILVGPIVNPVVLAATYTAFRSRPELIYSRMGLALLVGVTIGLLVYFFIKEDVLKPASQDGDSFPHSGHQHNHDHRHDGAGKFVAFAEHAGNEFFDMGKYVMIGSVLTAAIQSLMPRSSLTDIAQTEISSSLFMMGFAYILSICSTSDAFVASSFASLFPASSLLAFLVFGPMLDFKSTLMLLSVFKKRFVLQLSLMIFAAVFTGAFVVGHYIKTL
nr:permease [Paenibacillus sp. NEAU-GSW1]